MIARKCICKGLDISVEDLFIDIDRLARAFYPAILACWNSEEGQRSLVGARPLHLLSQTVLPLKSPTGAFIAPLRCANASLPWQAEQAHHTTSKEKQSVPDGKRPVVHIAVVCGFWQGASGWTYPAFYDASSFSARSIRYPTPTWV